MPEENKKKGLKAHTIILMIVVALFFDVLQWLLAFIFMDWLAGLFAGLTFYVWFKLYGLSFMKPKRLATFSGTIVAEMIPLLAALPAWTAAVTYLALDAKAKEVIPGSVASKLDIMKK
ncbi:MAG: hypothetical protein EXS69_01405 [Candidatus Zambryskibacteria bacterium]|nr:hypothetical protein [Candidatus Zambryskibacteria bacterium]